MTLSTTDNREQYNGDGVQVDFPYTFLVLTASHLKVWVDNVLTTDWSISGLGNSAGGTVTFNSAPPTGTGNVVFLRQVPLQQLTDYEEYDPFPAETHEGALDYLTMIDQQQQEELDRAVKYSPLQVPPEDFTIAFGTAAERAGKLWAFDDTGLLVIVIDPAEEKAYRWAEEDESVVVENRDGRDRYSAYHWAQKAENISDLPLTAKGDILTHDGSGYSVVSQASLGAVNGDVLVIDDSQLNGFNYATPDQVLPVILAGDKLKILKVTVDETGYELAPDYTDHIVHAKDMLNDDESGTEITAYHVSHYTNTAMLFENPSSDAAGAQCWINGLVVRHHNALDYSLRLRVAKSVGDVNSGNVAFRAQSYRFPREGSLNPAAYVFPAVDVTVTLPASDEDGVNVLLQGVIPVDITADPDMLVSISIKRLATANTYVGQVDVVLAELEVYEP